MIIIVSFFSGVSATTILVLFLVFDYKIILIACQFILLPLVNVCSKYVYCLQMQTTKCIKFKTEQLDRECHN